MRNIQQHQQLCFRLVSIEKSAQQLSEARRGDEIKVENAAAAAVAAQFRELSSNST